ncbi:MAG: hypothetical protein GTO24_00930 [candidate division Zixibacteria bacterium]|nr:hypothetical protein [candidate division Zixibacteria bacterium]
MTILVIDKHTAFPAQIAAFPKPATNGESPKAVLTKVPGLIEPSLKIPERLKAENITVERLPVYG